MDISICSFSFHRLVNQGRQDIFKYISDCKELGCTLLDPWNRHLAELKAGDDTVDPAGATRLTAAEEAYLDSLKSAARSANLPLGCIAVDGAHIFEATPEARRKNRARACRWLEISRRLGARQVRIDAGGDAKMDDSQFALIVAGYKDLLGRAASLGLELLMENHWGASQTPANVHRIMDASPGLGLLFDTFNWAPARQAEGWLTCARYARCTHVKTFAFDDQGDEMTQNLANAFRLLRKSGYGGCWGVESVPFDGDEIGAARKTIALIRRCA